MEKLTPEEIGRYRLTLQQEAVKLIGVKYKMGAEWLDRSKVPDLLDCSEMIEGLFLISGLPMPDGSQAQFDATLALSKDVKPQIGDLGFFSKDGNLGSIYHVGMVYDAVNMIEARAFDPTAKFKTGEVILRAIDKWANYKNFVGFRMHPKFV